MIALRSTLLVLAALAAGAPAAAAASDAIAPFIGEFHGRSISDATASGLDERDLSVTIARTDEGFRVAWTTVTRVASGREKKKSYTVSFIPTKRSNIYSSAMKTNVFGGREALDPLQGDPYVWARIDGRVLTIYALIINDSGGYEMQTYARTVTASGMDLRFTRISEGAVQKSLRGKLERVE